MTAGLACAGVGFCCTWAWISHPLPTQCEGPPERATQRIRIRHQLTFISSGMRLTEPRLSGHRGGLTSGNASALRATTALRPQVPCFSNAGLQAPHSPLQGSAARTSSTATPMHAACHPALSSGRRRGLTLAAAAAPTAPAAAVIVYPPFLDAREGMRDEAGRLLLRNLTLAELEEWCESVGEAPARARHLYQVSQGGTSAES